MRTLYGLLATSVALLLGGRSSTAAFFHVPMKMQPRPQSANTHVLPLAHQSEIAGDLDLYRSVGKNRLNWEALQHSQDISSLLDAPFCFADAVNVWVKGKKGFASCKTRNIEQMADQGTELVMPPQLVQDGRLSPILQDFLGQPHAELLPELTNATAFDLLVDRAMWLTTRYPRKVDMSSQDFPYRSEDASATTTTKTTARASTVPRSVYLSASTLFESFLREQQRTATAVAVTTTTKTMPTVGPAWTRRLGTIISAATATETATDSYSFTTLGISERAAIWASQYPEASIVTSTATAKVTTTTTSKTASRKLQSSYVTTTTLTPLYEGDPIPTITQYSLWLVEVPVETGAAGKLSLGVSSITVTWSVLLVQLML